MKHGECAAGGLRHLVVRHVVEAHFAGIGPVDVAELGFQLLAALGHVSRREREVALRRDVPVERRRHFKAAARIVRIIGREEAGLALVVERERAVGHRQDGGVEELEPAAAHRPARRVVVDLHLGGLEAPVFLARLAGGEGALRHAEAALAEEFQALAVAAHGRILAVHDEIRLLEHAGVVAGVVAQARPEEAVDAAQQAHAAVGLDAAEFLVVAQEFGVHGQLLLLKFHLAARRDFELGHAVDLFGLDPGRCRGLGRLGRRGRRRFGQHRRLEDRHLSPGERRAAQQNQECRNAR